MSYEHGTPHYNLPQTIGTDKRDWFDTNNAFADVDADLYAAKTGAETAVHDIGVVEASVTALEGRVSTAEGDIDTLEAGLATANENIGINSTAIADVRTQLGADKQDLKDTICAIEEASATAEYRHEVGTFFWYNDTLYKTTVLIPVGQQIVPNVNCSTTNITTELLAGGSGSVSADAVTFDNSGTDLSSTNVEDAVKEVNTKVNEKQSATDNNLTTTSKQIVGAINEVNTAIANYEQWTYLTSITTTSGTYSVDFSQYKAVKIISVYSGKIDSVEIYTNLLSSTALQHRMISDANGNIGAFNITNSAITEGGNSVRLYVYVTA